MSAALPEAALDQLFRNARTYNHYLDKPVEGHVLEAIWDLVKFGPTSANSLPARIVWCVSDEAKGKLAPLCSSTNADKVRKAPVTAIIGMDVNFHDNLPEFFPHAPAMKTMMDGLPELAREMMALRNSSLQGAYFIIAARALGLDTGPMSGFNNAAVDEAFFADMPGVKSNFIATLGYGEPGTPHARLPRPDFARFNTVV
ncbi:malonic semialdehyde reductase [Novosphingobium aquae]|uniref:Malonic semialdehyde reductase n=1 Tax=Novosphingobium aquae TaxID=3133435 RepID=A0ABU8SBS2_9SPHN